MMDRPTCSFNPTLKSRIVVKKVKWGRKVRYQWTVEQKAAWAYKIEREKPDYVDNPRWERVRTYLTLDELWSTSRRECDFIGHEKTFDRAELAARTCLAQQIVACNSQDREKQWECENTTIIKVR